MKNDDEAGLKAFEEQQNAEEIVKAKIQFHEDFKNNQVEKAKMKHVEKLAMLNKREENAMEKQKKKQELHDRKMKIIDQ